MEIDVASTSLGQASRRGGGRPRRRNARPNRLNENAIEGAQAGSTSNAQHHVSEGPSRSSRGRGRGRSAVNRPPRTVNGRQFGGSLTQDITDTPTIRHNTSHLQPDAIAFVPSQVFVPSKSANGPRRDHKRISKPEQPPKPRAPKSQAPDIATRTHEDIDNGHYECPICTSEVERRSKVWSCNLCWTVFHLSCVKKWATNEGSAASRNQPENGELPLPRQWRCPGCNLPKDELPSQYTCWCAKEIEPRAPIGLPPHSCGQSCIRDRPGRCPHPHTDICHAGPCPPCTEMGPTKSCFCGSHQLTKPCTQTDYDHSWSCGEPCAKPMSCGEHICQRDCHDGPCGPCEVRLPARCYCGKLDKDILCQDREDARLSYTSHSGKDGQIVAETWTGTFNCGTKCGRAFDCNQHYCERTCHEQTLEPAHCRLSPDMVTHCPCGRTPLAELRQAPRDSCMDPIPSCDKPCAKPLPCGHECPAVCHSNAECPPCLQIMEIKCRCGRTSSTTLCHQGVLEPPLCRRICRTTLNCGRHACDEHCCSGERKAIERQSAKRRHRPLGSAARPIDDLMEPEHICTRMCGKILSCGNHQDESLCHKGPCGTCREAIFEEISCHCGRTVIQPPLPCGTPPPPCRYLCTRSKACGHMQVAHNCHQDEESCPRCPFLVEKRCMCGKKTLKNQQCWLADVRCGEICGRLLKCGSHRCRKPCHPTGDCEDADGACRQPCGKSKPICGHPDEAPCHSVFACKQELPCQSKIFITCPCQAQKQEAKCGASKSHEGNGNKTLPCNDECARLERNRKLALALNIDRLAHVDGGDHIPYSAETLNLFSLHTKWAQQQEREFRVFATSDDEKRLRFKPMKAAQRQFIHLLAEDFGLDSESMDPEPNRHVMIWKTPRFLSPPNKTLAEALRIRQLTRGSAISSANVSDAEGLARKSKPSNEVGEPYNAFIIRNPRFALTVDELRSETAPVVPTSAAFTFEIEFLPSEEVVLRAATQTLKPEELQQELRSIQSRLNSALIAKKHGSIELCVIDHSLNVLRRESDSGASGTSGWSRVAAKKAAPRGPLPGSTASGLTNNPFAALTGNKLTFARKQVIPSRTKSNRTGPAEPMVVVDDWETAETAEEQKEQHRDVAPETHDETTLEAELPETTENEPDHDESGVEETTGIEAEAHENTVAAG